MTNNSSTLFQGWELLVLNRLKWDLATVTACNFFDHILHELQLPRVIDQQLRPHLQLYIALITIGKSQTSQNLNIGEHFFQKLCPGKSASLISLSSVVLI